MRRALLALLLVWAAPVFADLNLPPAEWANQELPNPAQEAEAKALMELLRCVVCQGQSIADSDAEIAGDMRGLVRSRIAAGEKPEDIRSWMIERYGQWVSYDPGLDWATAPLWIAPILFVIIGVWLASKRIRRRGQ